MASDFRIVVVGASAGGVSGLQEFVAGLPAHLPAAVFVVLHIRPDAISHLPEILSAKGPLPAAHPRDGEEIRPERIYVAVPDHHLLIDGDRIGVKKGPKENRFRPSIDALFRSAAYNHRASVIGVVLSGALDDGTSGLWSIKQLGGIAIVQDPQEAAFGSMPLNALERVDIDYRLPAKEIGPLVARLAGTGARRASRSSEEINKRIRIETEVAASTNAFKRGIMEYGALAPFTCPECHGALVEIIEGPLIRYRCHTGHGFTTSALLAGITESVEPALWEVTRALEECVMLLDHMGRHLADAGRSDDARRFAQKARETEARARALQELTIKHEHLSEEALRDQ